MVTGLASRVASWSMHRMSAEDRSSAIDALMVAPSSAMVRRFAVLMFLSSLVAAMGLLQNSAAVVIGAMMIAPLMGPIMGIAASMIMGWGQRLLRGLLLVFASAAGAIGVGWFFAMLLAAGTGLPAQVVERSSPDIRDLLVALGAGAAGAYATVHKNMSGALPGVAVAVAVVPPLVAVGVLLGYGQPQLARGAALLFLTNLVGIVLMAALVFLRSGLVPRHRLRTHGRRIFASLVMAAVLAVAVALILLPRFVSVTSQAHDLKVATQTITNLLSPGSRLSHITTTDSRVRADITGPTAPPPIQDVAAALSRALGRPVTAQIGWIPVMDPERSEEEREPQLPLSELSPVVEKWLVTQSLTLQGLSYQSGTLVVSTAGPNPPESSEDLRTLIDERFSYRLPVSLAWTHTPAASEPSDTETALGTARKTTATWASATPDTAVLNVTGSAEAITVTLIGETKPDVDTLQADLRTALPQATITIQWVPGGMSIVDSPTPTTTPRPTTTPTPTPTPPR